jgi:hypothetical protein
MKYFCLLLRSSEVSTVHFSGSQATYRYSEGLRTGQLGFNSWQGSEILSFTASSLALGSTQPPIQWVLGVLTPGVKQTVCEADHHPIQC